MVDTQGTKSLKDANVVVLGEKEVFQNLSEVEEDNSEPKIFNNLYSLANDWFDSEIQDVC